MSDFEFRIVETKRNGYIAWDAIDAKTGNRFPVNAAEPYTAGTFPEITEYLKSQGAEFAVAYLDSCRDSLSGTTWSYSRGNDKVTVHDIPRTIFSITVD
ncbi:hypothetical protein GIY21_02800 [Xanthomonas sontii]|uniref:Uncharacterized protein n=1 Tax=Xanthomonas sontii TaxID=2650745 RepID=A0A6N7Q457_9XANT|nr:hypothetical protein [Xanthomonas sontii]MRG99212.1 hypothetical protein [Xanthomonas sontii]MRH73544.1 hypothetical protein [Xanthomonas sontii]